MTPNSKGFAFNASCFFTKTAPGHNAYAPSALHQKISAMLLLYSQCDTTNSDVTWWSAKRLTGNEQTALEDVKSDSNNGMTGTIR